MLREIADSLEEDLKRTGFSGRTVVVKYKVSFEIVWKEVSSHAYLIDVLQLHTYESECTRAV
jgi:hypothetical protein